MRGVVCAQKVLDVVGERRVIMRPIRARGRVLTRIREQHGMLRKQSAETAGDVPEAGAEQRPLIAAEGAVRAGAGCSAVRVSSLWALTRSPPRNESG